MTSTIKADFLKVFENEIALSEKDEGWYRSHKRWWMYLSQGLKLLAFFFFAAGSLIPFADLAGATRDADTLAMGYPLLIIAGLLFSFDQLFIGSRNWSRFVKAELAIRHIKQALMIERERFRLTAPDDLVTPDWQNRVFDVVSKSRQDIKEIVLTETGTWLTEIEAAAGKFTESLKASTDSAKASIDALRKEVANTATAKLPGALEVKFTGYERVQGKLKLIIGTKILEYDSAPDCLAFDGLATGRLKVSLNWSANDVQRSAEKLVDITPGTVSSISFNLP